ncbi:hypothetical protein [Streptomyces cyaneofuscatus]|uniref:hypothetical protein n=1 Tax=Streptomyces cyaneofuscatus TaxID=66883 RepID=UPI00378B74E2
MITPRYRAVAYAATVTLRSMAVQATLFLLLLMLSGDPAGDMADLLITPLLAFPFFSIVVLTVTRISLPAQPRLVPVVGAAAPQLSARRTPA